MVQIEMGKIVPEQTFFCRDWNGTEIGTKFFYQNRNQHFFIRNDNFYGRVRHLSNIILSQLMCHTYSSKTLDKSLSRDSQSVFGTGNGIKVLLLTGTGIGPR